MADGKSTESKSGPVKPPVLEGTAREAGKPDTGAAKAASKPAGPAKDEPVKAQEATPRIARQGQDISPIWSALAGGVLGLAAAYGLAWAGLWPSAPVEIAPADPRLAQLTTAIPELRTVTETTQSELAALNQRISGLEAGGPAPAADMPAADIAGIEADIAALTARIDDLNPPASSNGSSQDVAVAAVRQSIAGLEARLNELSARVGTTEAGVQTLQTSVAATSAALDEQPSDIGAVLQLPLILSGFEAAFGSGRPYESELAALRAAIPDVSVPTRIANEAASGLTRADVIAARFGEVLPAMLAGRPANPDAGWQDGALDWFRSAIALRPTGETEGDDPQAVVSRLEAAIARRDFAMAETLFASLPAPMLAAAEEVPAEIAAQAEAARFLDGLRQQALIGIGGAAS
jgi:hypothetical protein